MTGSRSIRSSAERLAGVGVASFVQLGLELLFMKLAHYEFGALSLGVVGLTLLGVSLGAPLTRWLGGAERAAGRALVLLPLAVLLAGVVLFGLEHRASADTATFLQLLAPGAVCLTALALSTVPIYVEITRAPGSVYSAYAASLLGGALGVPTTLALVHWFGDAAAFASIAGAAAPAALLLVPPRGPRRPGVALAVACAVVGGFLFPRLDARAHPRSVYTETNALSRIDVEPVGNRAFAFRTAGVNAGTTTPSPVGTDERDRLLVLASALPFRSAPKRVLILGSGGGKNVVQALELGSESVIAVEINGMIPEYMRRALAPGDDPYRDPRVTLLVGEGREVAARMAQRIRAGEPPFDLVYVPLAAMFGSSGHALTETYLMTREAFALYLGMLAPDGLVCTYFVDVARPKVVAALAAGLRARGVAAPEAHIAVVERDHFVALARPSRAFDDGERQRFERQVAGGRAVAAGPVIELGAQLLPLSDDNPFLYNDVERLAGRRGLYGHTLGFLRVLLIIGLLLLSAGVLAALRYRGPPSTLALGYTSAFAAMGVAYTVVQTGLIQRLGFLLGHPVLAAAVILPGTLLGTGIGSWLSGRVPERAFSILRLSTTALLVAGVLLIAGAKPAVLLQTVWSPPARLLAGAAFSTLPFIVMGSFFPVIFARAEQELEGLAALAWLVNGVAAVVGTLFAVYGAMRFGFRFTLGAAALLYAALGAWDVLVRKPRAALAANCGLLAVLVATLGGGALLL